MKYYLAYGSNMVKEQMDKRCPNAKQVAIINLEGYELKYKQVRNGIYLDLVESSNSYVPTVLWEIDAEDEKNLDEYEDYPYSYIKEYIDTPHGKALVYLVNPQYTIEAIPDDKYYTPIKETYIKLGFDINILNKNLKKEA